MIKKDEIVPDGGLKTWAPSITPGIGVELDHEEALACAFRILAGLGWSENIAGHITWDDRGDGSMLVNPWGLWWNEITAGDVCRVDQGANRLEGRWDVTPAIHIHTELHRRRPDARVVIHNHPPYATVLSALGIVPGCYHQTATMFDGDVVLVAEYTGEVDDPDKGAELAAQIGDAPVALLANHGVLVTGATIAEAVYRAANFEQMCWLTTQLLMIDRDPTSIQPRLRPGMKASLLERGSDVFWAGAVRQLLNKEPQVLDRGGVNHG